MKLSSQIAQQGGTEARLGVVAWPYSACLQLVTACSGPFGEELSVAQASQSTCVRRAVSCRHMCGRVKLAGCRVSPCDKNLVYLPEMSISLKEKRDAAFLHEDTTQMATECLRASPGI